MMHLRRTFAALLSILIAVSIFIGVFYFTDTSPADIFSALDMAGMRGVILVLAVMIGQLMIQAWSWQILLRGAGNHIKWWHLFQAILAGWAGNFVTPSMYLGGEPLRALVLQKYSGIPFRTSLASVLVHKFLEFATFLIFILLGVVLTWYRFASYLPLHVEIIVLICVLGLVALWVILAISMFRRYRFISNIAQRLILWKIYAKFFQKYLTSIAELEDYIFDSLQQHRTATAISFLVMLLFDVLILIRPLAFFGLTKDALDVCGLAFLFLAIQLILALQFTPGGLGIFEGGLVAVFSILQIPAPQALAYALLCRLGDVLIVSTGFALICYLGIEHYQKPKATVPR